MSGLDNHAHLDSSTLVESDDSDQDQAGGEHVEDGFTSQGKTFLYEILGMKIAHLFSFFLKPVPSCSASITKLPVLVVTNSS